MGNYFLGIDVGSTKSHALIADETGRVLGIGVGGAGNYEGVGCSGYQAVLHEITGQALQSAGIPRSEIAAAGFGISGYDWPAERTLIREGIAALGLGCPVKIANDTIIGLKAGAPQGWGVALVAGTGTNCYGLDANGREAHITGAGMLFGEFGGGIDIAWKTLHCIGYAWTRRGPQTRLTDALVHHLGAKHPADLLEGLALGRYRVGAEIAPLVFDVARAGDRAARDVITWLARELAFSALGVIRQLALDTAAFDLVLIGGIFNGGELLLHPLEREIRKAAPGVRFTRLTAPPAIGGVLLAMEAMEEDERIPCKSVYRRLTQTAITVFAGTELGGSLPPGSHDTASAGIGAPESGCV